MLALPIAPAARGASLGVANTGHNAPPLRFVAHAVILAVDSMSSLGFSKKLENLAAATAIHVAVYNFCRVHRIGLHSCDGRGRDR